MHQYVNVRFIEIAVVA